MCRPSCITSQRFVEFTPTPRRAPWDPPDGGEGNEGGQGFGEVLGVLGETPVSVVYFVIVAPYKFMMARQGKVVFGDPPATKTCPRVCPTT